MNSDRDNPQSLARRLIDFWKNSSLFHWLDLQISHHYQKKLTNDNFTILCSNCIGGALYHRLGKRFLSPTINMFIRTPDFIFFCVHLDYYLQQELRFIDSDNPYPVAQLLGQKEIPTITLYFNHASSVEEATQDWERRKVRIRKDNLYIMLYNLDGITNEHIRLLEQVPCNNKVIFTSVPLKEIPWSCYIKPIMSHRYPYSYLEKDIFGVRYYEKHFDFVSFINKKP